ncbi:MAG TPA: uroporphyrinogen-III synthase [Gemmatimonadaceae bacterium]|nr:uroporphyrinogen-III synthase [Gemmatimonadaceae bacterium]
MTPETGAGSPAELPLQGCRIVVTREAARAGGLVEALASRGAEVSAIPIVRTERLDPAPLWAALRRLEDFDWLLFTSRTGVRLVLEELATLGLGPAALARLRLGAVGPATAGALGEAGLSISLVPDQHTAEGLLEAMVEHEELRGRHVLYVAAEAARDVLQDGLARRGAQVTVVHAYRTLDDQHGVNELRQVVAMGQLDVVIVAAPSAVQALARAVAGTDVRVRVATIGPVTTAAAREAGLEVIAEAEEATPGGLVRALCAWASRREPGSR